MASERPDAVIIGSGPNGLAAAITLAEKGRSVLVLEAADQAGGAVRTEELTLPGFRHDTFSSVYPATVASPVFSRMPLERHGLRWVHPEIAMSHVLDEGRAALLSRDIAVTVASLDALHPGDGARWRAFAEPYLREFGAVRATVLSGFPPIKGPVRLLRGLGVQGALEFARLLLMPAQGLADDLFEGDGARAWLYGAAMHADVPPHGSGSAIGAAYLNLLGHAVGWPSPEGGAGRLSEALIGYLRELGGEVRTSARVSRVIVEKGRVAGVEIDGGERVSTRIVIGDVTPGAIIALAGEDALGKAYTTALRRFRHGPATVKVDWALSGPIPWSNPDTRRAGTVHVGGSSTEVNRATAPIGEGLAETPFLLAGQQSVADPTRAPAGQHTAWAYTHGPQGTDWEAETDAHVERMEAQIERFAPGFGDLILGRHVLSPATLHGRNSNLVGGDVGGGSYALDQVVFRPVPSLTPYRTSVRGLYIGSASAFPGGAVHGVPGASAANAAHREALVRRW